MDQSSAARRVSWWFVRSLAHRIAGFPAAGRAVLKDRVTAISLAQPTSSVAIRISSWSARAIPRHSAEPDSRCRVGFRLTMVKWRCRAMLGSLADR